MCIRDSRTVSSSPSDSARRMAPNPPRTRTRRVNFRAVFGLRARTSDYRLRVDAFLLVSGQLL
eukprot:2057978-Alexandrium_andersonii.AAC.1